MNIELQQLEQLLNHRFNNPSLLSSALTHPSYLHESAGTDGDDYQRLEYLGDAVLGMLLAEMLYHAYPDWDEGSLSRFRARLAGQDVLADRARMLGIGDFIFLGRGEVLTEGRAKDSILSDILESLLAALYLDGGLNAARNMVERLFLELVADPQALTLGRDSKSELQELLSACNAPLPEYKLVEESGPPHDRNFQFQVLLDGRAVGEGQGKSKKNAQQAAAAQALGNIKVVDGQIV